MKILFITHSAYHINQYEGSFISKIINVLSKYFEVKEVIYLRKEDAQQWVNKPHEYNALPHLWQGKSNKFKNLLFIYRNNLREIRNNDCDLVWFALPASLSLAGVFIYKWLNPKRRYFVQLTTPSVNKSKPMRFLINTLMRMNINSYDYIGVGEEITLKKLKVPEKKIVWVSVGFPDYIFNKKTFNIPSLVYVGTLNGRNIWKTVIGIKLFTQKFPSIKLTYNIVGKGTIEEVKKLEDEIKKNELSDIVHYHGFLNNEGVKKIFLISNAGVAFLPVVEYYQNSSTKIIEYLLAGMPVISTKNEFSKNTLTNETGLLCEDTPEGFAAALEILIMNFKSYNSEKIRDTFNDYTMESVMKEKYIPQIKNIIMQSK